MAVTLVINPGSSSKKYAFYEDEQVVLKVSVERTSNGVERRSEHRGIAAPVAYHGPDAYRGALTDTLQHAIAEEVIADEADLARVCVRVVAPGTRFQEHRRVDEAFVRELHAVEAVAPLHVPHTLAEIETVRTTLPETPLVAASDSAFHATLPPVARTYSISPEEAAHFDLYRFGYHGLSVASIARRLPRFLGEMPQRVVVAHIGSGVSVSALRDGVSVETSMGFSPGTGLVMASRAGDVDSGALLELMRIKNHKLVDAHTYLQTRGGLIGLANDRDLRQVLERRAAGEAAATAAVAKYAYHLRMQIAAQVAALGGLDALILTATAAERSSTLRSLIVEELSFLGLELDPDANEACVGRDGVITAPESPATAAVLRTDEMGEMYRVAVAVA